MFLGPLPPLDVAKQPAQIIIAIFLKDRKISAADQMHVFT
jgi:hypothetical protein